VQIYPPRPLLLSRAFVPFVAPKTEILFKVPKGANYYLSTFAAVWPVTVAANIQATDNLAFRLYASSDPYAEESVLLGAFTTPANQAILRSRLMVHKAIRPQSVIMLQIFSSGQFASAPSDISVTIIGRAGWEVK